MVRNATKDAPAVTTEAPKEDKPKVAPLSAFTWDDIADEAVEYTQVTATLNTKPRKDWEAETPEPIKNVVKKSHDLYREAFQRVLLETDGDRQKALNAAVRVANRSIQCKSPAQAEALIKAARGYGDFLNYTVRAWADKDNPSRVLVRAMPKVTRVRKAK